MYILNEKQKITLLGISYGIMLGILLPIFLLLVTNDIILVNIICIICIYVLNGYNLIFKMEIKNPLESEKIPYFVKYVSVFLYPLLFIWYVLDILYKVIRNGCKKY